MWTTAPSRSTGSRPPKGMKLWGAKLAAWIKAKKERLHMPSRKCYSAVQWPGSPLAHTAQLLEVLLRLESFQFGRWVHAYDSS